MATAKNLYKDLKEILDPSHTCLVLWDVQKGLVNSIFNREQFLKNLSSLLNEARRRGIPVVYTRITPLPFAFESPFKIHRSMRAYGIDDPAKLPLFMTPGSPEAEIHSNVKPEKSDTVIHKHTASIFIGTYFEYMMRNAGIKTILFTGIATDIGIDSCARDSSNRGFYTVVVSDCVSSSNKEMHDMSLAVLEHSVCPVIPSGTVIEHWKHAEAEARLMPVK